MIRLKSLVTEAMISEALRYHINKNISIHDNVFRYGSEAYCNLMLEAKRLLTEGKLEADVYDREVLSTDIGEFGLYEGVHVPLDLPMSEAEYQGKDVGKLLYQKALAIAKQSNVEYIWLGVWEKNVRAINFYKKNGFITFDTHIFKLGDEQQTDFMMKLQLVPCNE